MNKQQQQGVQQIIKAQLRALENLAQISGQAALDLQGWIQRNGTDPGMHLLVGGAGITMAALANLQQNTKRQAGAIAKSARGIDEMLKKKNGQILQ